ncbi:MAG: membrane protein insertase YidC [Clostridiales bacterium]|nr:membrane protein insertase YidC [Clostridiales bacterium]
MSFGQLLYQLLIFPLEIVIEVVYGLSFIILRSYGWAIFPLSLAVNLLLLPFYKRADSIQREESDRQKQMAPYLSHIKKSFHGDERYMMIQAYYRENKYMPVYALRSSLPLLLQIPFFIAAYHFLSNLSPLSGYRFLCFSDLGAPDKLISAGGLSINLLPVLMTVINVISSEIYSKGKSLKDRLQLHGMALVFLVLLYNSPSGLVIYWTLNNLFSLIKNIIASLPKPKIAACIAYSLISVSTLFYALVFYKGESSYRSFLLVITFIFLVPAIRMLPEKELGSSSKKKGKAHKTKPAGDTDTSSHHKCFIYGAVFLSLLTGLLIPSEVIRSSPGEFVLVSYYRSPLWHLAASLLLSTGFFLIWLGLLYYLGSRSIRKNISCAVWIFSIVGATDYFLFGKGLGMLSSELHYTVLSIRIAVTDFFINTCVIIAVSALLFLIYRKFRRAVTFIYPVLILSVLGMGIFNTFKISRALPQIREVLSHQTTEEPSFTLSRTGQNVVVIMVDRGLSPFLPYIFQEKPELETQFSGFTWYPNTLSMGANTISGSPELFGGYDYIPQKMNIRKDEKMVDKHNEALKVMPVVFSESGFDVTVCDPPYAGYSNIPDLSIYDDYPQIKAYNTEHGQFRDLETDNTDKELIWRRNFFCYSFMKLLPLFLQETAYQEGTYFSGDSLTSVQRASSMSEATGYNSGFMDSYYALSAFPEMTVPTDEDSNHFLMITNSMAHNIALLSEPEYEPSLIIDNTEYDLTHQDRLTYNGVSINLGTPYLMAHYQSNMCAMIKLGEWLDYLREEGLYDNTRIIIVSDHGQSIGQFESMRFGGSWHDETDFNPEDAMVYNALLLVKDFNSNGAFATDYTFMTNADTPSLALSGIIGSPVNPFTGTRLDDTSCKNAEKLYVFYTDEWEASLNEGNTFAPGLWCTVSNQDIFDKDNWETVGVQ